MLKDMVRIFKEIVLNTKKIQYQENTLFLMNEEKVIIMLSFYLCVIGAIANYIYFVAIKSEDITQGATRSIVLLAFGFFYLITAHRKLTRVVKVVMLILTTMGITAYTIVSFYQLIGPAIWTYMFLTILIMTTRNNYIAIVLVTLLMGVLSVYLNIAAYSITLTDAYYVSQSIGFIMIGIVALTVFHLNVKKNNFLIKQQQETQKMNILLEQSNQSMNMEIKQHKQLQEELEISKKRFEAMIKALPDAVFTLDRDGYFIDCEIGNNDWLLFESEAFIGKNLVDIMPSHIALGSIEKIQQALDTSKTQIYNYELELPR